MMPLMQQQQARNEDYQTSYQMRPDPINFTNQYNIYNPVIGGPLTSAQLGTTVGPTANIETHIGATSPQQQQQQQFMQSMPPYNPLLAQYMGLFAQPDSVADYQNQLLGQLQLMQQ